MCALTAKCVIASFAAIVSGGATRIFLPCDAGGTAPELLVALGDAAASSAMPIEERGASPSGSNPYRALKLCFLF